MEEYNIKISIIVAIYNVDQFLPKCLESLISQTYLNIEIILVDDGSTDSSASICDEWSKIDSRIIVYHQCNLGVSAARNKGISAASGDYIVFVDSDDWIEKVLVEELVKNCKNQDWVLTGFSIDYEYKNKYIKKFYSKEEMRYITKEEVVSLFLSGLFSPIWNKLYERKLLVEKNIRFREDMNLGEDIIFNLEYLRELHGVICILNKPMYHYTRRNKDSLVCKYNENYMIMQKLIYKNFLSYLANRLADDNLRQKILCCYFNALVTTMDKLYLNRRSMT